MEKNFGCLFYLKKKGKSLAEELPIYLRITVDSDYAELSTKRKCFKSSWNVKAGRAEGKTDYAKSINSYLDTIQQKVFEAKRRLIELDMEITPLSIKDLMLGKNVSKQKFMLMDMFKHHNDQIKALVGSEYAKSTLERYETSYRHTLNFLQSRYKLSDIEITKLDYDFIAEYEFWLKSVRKCDHNTTMKYLSNFKKIVNRCVRSGRLQRNPFLGFKLTKREVERTALTELQLKAIAKKTFAISIVRDVFLFCCFTGLAYADVKKLKQSEIIEGTEGEKWIIAKRQKTDITSRIPLLQGALEIMKKYKDNVECQMKGTVLPVLSNQKMNAYLKEIADVCEIHTIITFHIARHTFATTITLSNGYRLKRYRKCLAIAISQQLSITQKF